MPASLFAAPLPDWLAAPAPRAPAGIPRRFAGRTAASLARMLAALRQEPSGAVHPPILLACSVLALVLLSLARQPAFVALCATSLLLVLAGLPLRLLRPAIGLGLALGGLSALVLAPALVWLPAGRPAALLVSAKAATGGLVTGLLAGLLGGRGLVSALAGLRLPGAIVLVLDLFLRYAVILGDLSLDLLLSLRLRSPGRPARPPRLAAGFRRSRTSGSPPAARPDHPVPAIEPGSAGNLGSMGDIAGTLFLASRHYAGEVHAAMICRGFDGTYRHRPGTPGQTWRRAGNLVAIGLVLGLGSAYLLLGAGA